MGEPWDVLIGLARDYPKVGVGGMARLKGAAKYEFARQCFARVWPKPLHGLGVGTKEMTLHLPWHSVDATNWEIGPCKFGSWKTYGDIRVRGSRHDLRVEIAHYLDIERLARHRWRREIGRAARAAGGVGVGATDVHALGHLALGLALAPLAGWPALVGALAPDAALALLEPNVRRVGVYRAWRDAAGWRLAPYRLTHSLWLVGLLLALWPALGVGWLSHVLADLPTHAGLLRQQPLWPLRWRWRGPVTAGARRRGRDASRDVVLVSGGVDSAAVAVLAAREGVRAALFLDYGQPYAAPERAAARYVARVLGLRLEERRLAPLAMDTTGAFADRNAVLLRQAARDGAAGVWFGTRNLHPWLDRFGDSNARWAARQERALGVPVVSPVVGWPKWLVRRVAARRLDLARLHSTEGYRPDGGA